MANLFAQLMSLTATKTVGVTDILVVSRADGGEFDGRITMSQGDKHDFDDFDLIPFEQQLELVLTKVNLGGQPQNLGSVFIRADELNRGDLTQQFRGAGALYDLDYKVFAEEP
jgi:hypothetical protein